MYQTKGKFFSMFGKIYRHQLDAKNRMRIPAKLREELGENYTITKGTSGCLFVFSEPELDGIREKLKSVSLFDAKAMKPLRIFTASAWDAEEDKQGRILIPENLREFAKIKKDVVVMKNGKCIEIWSAEVWDEYNSDDDFDDIVGNLGI